MAQLRIANSVRLILAMFQLYADIETGFGQAILNILKKNYPDQDIDASASQIGHKMMAIARRQLQGNDDAAMDSIQNYLTYIAVGSKNETDDEGNIVKDEEGNPVERTTPKPFDFAKHFDTWKAALNAIYSNVKRNAMGRSMNKTKRNKKEKGIDDSFGRKTEDGKAEDGESRIPTDEDTALGKALDDKAALKEFYDVLDEHIPDLKAFLSPNAAKLFDLIFEDNIGDFGSDVKANMNQATALKEKYPELYEENQKRWSGFVGDLRKKLLKEIWDYIETEMSNKDYARIREQFFSEADPSAVRKIEKQKGDDKTAYQKMLDENKVSRLKAKLEADGSLSKKDQGDLDRLSKRLKEQGVDVDAIKADADAGAAGAKKKKKEKKQKEKEQQQISSLISIAHKLSASNIKPMWL